MKKFSHSFFLSAWYFPSRRSHPLRRLTRRRLRQHAGLSEFDGGRQHRRRSRAHCHVCHHPHRVADGNVAER